MERFYRFGPVRICFRNFPHDGNWPFWEWKPDPWRAEDGEADFEIFYGTENFVKADQLLSEETTASCRRAYYLQEGGELLWQHLCLATGTVLLQLVLDAEGKRIFVTRDDTATYGIAAFEALTFLIFYAMLSRGILSLHGVLLEHNGNGFCICAPSGAGKTTHARLWRDHRNALILNSDRTTCFLDGDAWTAFGTPWCGTGGEAVNRNVPLKAVVILRRGVGNRAFPASASELFNLVLPHLAYPVRTATSAPRMLELLDKLLERVPVFVMECTPDEEAVAVLEKALEDCLDGTD